MKSDFTLDFIGVGAAFAYENYQSNMLLENRGKKLLIDAGGDVRFALRERGIYQALPAVREEFGKFAADFANKVGIPTLTEDFLRAIALQKSQDKVVKLSDLDAIYVSHNHGDHTHGFEWISFGTYFDPGFQKAKGKLKLIGNSKVLETLWESMKGGVRSIQGRLMTLDDYYNVHRVGENGSFEFEGTRFQLVQTVHVMDGFDIVKSYGLLFNGPDGRRVFLTTDTQFAPRQIETFYGQSDIIFHDCEISPFRTGIHAHYEDLKTLPKETKAKMWLYHYQDGPRPNAVADGFAGFIEQGQTFDFSVKPH